ncbi:MAG: response regulator [Verrucomicrobia bacterium]|nr:response regulator [Verrucomicrobiota bacterium]
MIDDRTEHALRPASERARYGARPTHRILVVDDDPSTRQLNTVVLTHAGYAVDAAEDGVVAWEALNTDNYDLLITDHNMPKVTGVELVKKLRAVHMALPVILATGTMPTEELDRHPGLQIEATLLKPFTIARLLETVQEVLRVNRSNASPGELPLTLADASPVFAR